jgi:signal transduction histidine kinase
MPPAERGRRRRWLRLRTVRSQVTWTAAGLVALVLVLSAFGLVAAQERVLTRGLDEALIQRADNIEWDVGSGMFGTMLPVEGDSEDSFLQLVDADGSLVAASYNASLLEAVGGPLDPGDAEVIRTVEGVALSNGHFRVLARSLEGQSGPLTLLVAKNLDDVHESVSILRRSLGIAIPIVTGLLAVLVWWLTGRVLRPVEWIRREVADIKGDELHRRVPTPDSEDEIARLASTMNEMLDRLEDATERQHRFVADASHELRGPVTRLRTSLEVTAAHSDGLDPAELFRELLADTAELQKLVDDLLFLARSEAGQLDAPHEPVDLDDLVLEEADKLRKRGAVEVDVSAVSAARTLGDADQLMRVVRNLSNNAERHADHRVTFALVERDGVSELMVADDGPGIAPEHREVVFKRFARLDEARSRDAGGSGLGLAIVHEIVARHDGVVGIRDHPGSGAQFVVELPRAE